MTTMNQSIKVEGSTRRINRIKVNKEMTDFHKTKTKINSMKESIVKDKLTIKFLNKMLHT